jgi:hypothetical protein
VQIPADSHIGNRESLGQFTDIDGFGLLQFLQKKVAAYLSNNYNESNDRKRLREKR